MPKYYNKFNYLISLIFTSYDNVHTYSQQTSYSLNCASSNLSEDDTCKLAADWPPSLRPEFNVRRRRRLGAIWPGNSCSLRPSVRPSRLSKASWTMQCFIQLADTHASKGGGMKHNRTRGDLPCPCMGRCVSCHSAFKLFLPPSPPLI